jgi:hypothetical protein
MMDCNEGFRSETITTFLDACGMRDIVLKRHGHDAPRTHKRGAHPIDALFATHSVQCVRAGYAGFDEGVQAKGSDHRCIWFDVTINSIFGHEMPPTNKPQARQLKCNDPRVVKCFNQYYFDFLRKHKLHERAFALEAVICYPLPVRLQRELRNLTVRRWKVFCGLTDAVVSYAWAGYHTPSGSKNLIAPSDFGTRCFGKTR